MAVPRATVKVREGTHFAPSLIGVGRRFPEPQLTNLLRHPEKRMRDGGMPPVNVDDAHLQLLVSYLSGLNASATPGVHTAAGPRPLARQVVSLPLPRLLKHRGLR